MKPATMKLTLLVVNIVLGVAVLGFAWTAYAMEDPAPKYIDRVQQVKLIPPSLKNDTQSGRNYKNFQAAFKSSFTATLRDPNAPVDTGPAPEAAKPKPAVQPLTSQVIVNGINRASDTNAMAILRIGSAQHLVEIGETIPNISPDAKFVRCPDAITAVFEYNKEEISLTIKIDPEADLSKPFDADPKLARGPVTHKRPGDGEDKPQGPFDDTKSQFDQAAGAWTISTEELDFVMSNLESLKQKITFTSSISNGEVEGIKIIKLEDDSLPYKRGFRKRDVIISVNGKRVSSTSELYALQHDPEIQAADKITVVYRRDGQEQSVTFQVK